MTCITRLKMPIKMSEIAVKTGFLVVAHKPIATAIVTVAQEIMGSIEDCVPIDIVSDESKDALQKQLEKAWSSLNAEQIVVLLDLEGATPCNVLKNYCKEKECLKISPLSLPLLLKLVGYRNLDLKELVKKAKQVVINTSFDKEVLHENS